MDMSLPAPKLLVMELQAAVQDNDVLSIGSLKFQRVWLQGTVVTSLEHGTLTLDDGSGVIDLYLAKAQQEEAWEPGMYVLVNGRYRRDTGPFVEVHKILDMSSDPDREATWYLEVAEVHERFYEPLLATVKLVK